jgi:serine/threonine protein kinase
VLTTQQPSIVKLICYDAELLSLELEFVGPNLSHYKDQNDISTMSNEVQDRILVDISNGIECIHNEGIIHLDIKPQNILLSSASRAVLCDFGASKIGRYGGTETKIIRYNGGTPCYTPPEYMVVDDKDQKRGFEGDIWAFGVTMLYVSGEIPLPRGHWIIADITKDQSAFIKMQEWIIHIESVKEKLPETSLIREMLERNPISRITAPQLVQKLLILQSKRVHQAKVHSSIVSQLYLQT